MRKIFILLAVSMALFSCSKENQPVEEKPPISVGFDYTFAKEGNMVKSANDDYTSFYNAMVVQKKVTPRNYEIQLIDKNTGMIYTHEGKWGDNNKIEILPSTYQVTGYSRPATKTVDTLSMVFNDEITIPANATSVTLAANYDSYLLLFDKESLSDVIYSSWDSSTAKGIDVNLKNYDNKFFYMFVRTFPYPNQNTLKLVGLESSITTIDIQKNAFEKGKYYYFDALTNSFNLPPMTAGN